MWGCIGIFIGTQDSNKCFWLVCGPCTLSLWMEVVVSEGVAKFPLLSQNSALCRPRLSSEASQEELSRRSQSPALEFAR